MPAGLAWLRRVGLSLAQVHAIKVHEAQFSFRDRGFVIRREPFVFCVVRREEFDARLADAARERGLTLEEDTRVRSVRYVGDLVEVKTDRGAYRARAVVGADGAAGVVRRAVARQRVPRVARLLEILVPAESCSNPHSSSSSPSVPGDGRALFDFSCMADDVQGYVWDFPTQVQGRPMRAVGVFDSRVRPRAPRADLRATLQTALARKGVALKHCSLKGHPLRHFHPRAALSAPRMLLVGDAAGVDPLLGEGISFALGYGDVAARALRDALKRDDFSFEDYRARVLAHWTGRSLQRRAAVARLLYRIRSRRLLRFFGWHLAPLVGWPAQRFLVDWGDGVP